MNVQKKLLFYKFLFQYWNNYADHHMFLRKTNLWHHWRSSLFALDMLHLHKIDIYFSVTTYLFIRRFEHINHKKQMDILFWPSRKLFLLGRIKGSLQHLIREINHFWVFKKIYFGIFKCSLNQGWIFLQFTSRFFMRLFVTFLIL